MKPTRIEQEKKIFARMTAIYCRGHQHGSELCGECREIITYAHERLDHCMFGERKTFCSSCPVHCYKPLMRDRTKAIMRYAGPRVVFYHPIMAIKHLLLAKRNK